MYRVPLLQRRGLGKIIETLPKGQIQSEWSKTRLTYLHSAKFYEGRQGGFPLSCTGSFGEKVTRVVPQNPLSKLATESPKAVLQCSLILWVRLLTLVLRP